MIIALIMMAVDLAGAPEPGIGFRTDGRGHYADADPPLAFSPEKGVVWAAPMPAFSNASPVIVGDRIFVCAEPDVLIAVDKATGKILWSRASPLADALGVEAAAASKPAQTHPDCGFTSATPVSDGNRVFAVFGSGVVAAYDLEGTRLWIRFVERPEHVWGHSASPVLAGGRLLVHVETLVALDPASGAEAGRQPAEKWVDQKQKRWGTCAAARIGDVPVVVTVSGRVIRASDGEVLFSGLPGLMCATPLVVDGVAFLVGEGKSAAVRLPASVDGKPEVLWSGTVAKEVYYSSPVLHDGLLYALSQRGSFSAIDAATGQEVYRQKLLLAASEKEVNAAFTSVTLAGKALFFAGLDGSVVVVRPGRTYEEIAQNRVETALRSTPVFEGTRMYLRAPGHLYCFGR